MPQDLDLSYLGLDIDDRDPQAIFDASLARYLELAPDARPRDGSIETLLLEAVAVAGADIVYAANRVPAAVVEGILALYGVPRSTGTPATGVVTLTLDGTRTLTVTAGQQLSDPTTGLTLIVSTTTTGTSVSTLEVPVETEDPGGAGNAITAGAVLDLIDSIPYVTAATVTTGFSGGSDPESDAAYLDRASTVLARVTSSLVLPEHFVAYCLQDTRVGRATAIDLYEPGGTPGSDIGHLTVFLYGRGAQLSAGVLAELETAMADLSASMVTIHVAEAVLVTQNVTITVAGMPGYTSQEVEDAVTAALASWLSPDSWTWGRDVFVSELTAVVEALTQVDYVASVTTPAGTITVDDDELVTAGTITVTVA